jgi:hypothetical protein
MPSSKQPFSATLLLWLVLLFTLLNGLRLWTAIAWRAVLSEFSAASPLYIGVSGIVWLGIGAWLLWSLLLRKPKARTLLVFSATGYSVWYWCDRFFWQAPRPNWPFALTVNLALLSYIFVVSSFWKRETHE